MRGLVHGLCLLSFCEITDKNIEAIRSLNLMLRVAIISGPKCHGRRLENGLCMGYVPVRC